MSTNDAPNRPGTWARFRSRQSGCPSGPVGLIFGRLMVPTTAPANDAAINALGLTTPSVVLEVGFGQGRTVARLTALGHRVIGVNPSPTMVRQARRLNRRAVRAGAARLEPNDGIRLPSTTTSQTPRHHDAARSHVRSCQAFRRRRLHHRETFLGFTMLSFASTSSRHASPVSLLAGAK